MKIHEMDSFLIHVGCRNQLLIRVRTADGRIGWGESGYTGREQSVVGALDHLRTWLIGKDPRRRDALFQEMTRSGYYENGRSLTAAAAAVDIALHDLVARELELPVYELLGGAHRDSIRCYAHAPAPLGPQLVEQVRQVVEAGWPCVRVLLAHEPLADDTVYDPRLALEAAVEWLPRIRDVIGHRAVLGLHGHHRLNPFEAATLMQRLPPGTVDYFEEPIRAQSVAAYAALRTQTRIPFAHGTEITDKWGFAPFLQAGLMDLARVDVGLVGLTEAKKIAALAEAHYVDIMPHNPLGPIATAAAVHLAAAVPNHAYLEVRESPSEDLGFYDRKVFPQAPLPDAAGTIALPTEPGLGVTVDEEHFDAAAVQHEEPHFRKIDGSYTNW